MFILERGQLRAVGLDALRFPSGEERLIGRRCVVGAMANDDCEC